MPEHILIKKKIKYHAEGSGAKLYMTNGLLIYDEIFTYFLIY